MPLITFAILVIFGVVASQNQDVNLQAPYRKMIRQRSVEAATTIPPDPRVDNEGLELLLTRLENLCVEKLEFLITDTNERFQSLEHQSSSTVDIIKEKLDNLTTEVGQMSQCCSGPATPVVPSNENLEAKVENLNKDIRLLMNATRILSSNVEAVQGNLSSLINHTRSNFNNGLLEQETLQTVTSAPLPLSCSLDKQCPKNCKEVRESGTYASGIYIIQPEHAPKPFEAVCDLETRGGNWTVIQRRFDGSQDFFLDWKDYKNGFGNLTGEFWLGLEHIHHLTGYEDNELLVELGDAESRNASAFYSQFTVGSEIEGYSLESLGSYSHLLGDAGDSLTRSLGAKFSTKDVDPTTCARSFNGAWWYSNCANCNLNGKYLEPGQTEGYTAVHWYSFKWNSESLKHTRMLVRPKV